MLKNIKLVNSQAAFKNCKINKTKVMKNKLNFLPYNNIKY